MKKLFTLVALLAVFMGAKAVNWDEVKKIDYKGLTDFPYYIMGYAPDIVNGIMVDNPVPYRKLWRETDEGFADVAAQCTQVTINGGTLNATGGDGYASYYGGYGIGSPKIVVSNCILVKAQGGISGSYPSTGIMISSKITIPASTCKYRIDGGAWYTGGMDNDSPGLNSTFEIQPNS